MALILRGKITDDGKIDLLDPIPDDFDRSQEVTVILKDTLQQSINEFGDPVWIDEETGMISPVNPLTYEEAQSYIGLWADRTEEIGNSVDWIKGRRRTEEERDDPWRGQALS